MIYILKICVLWVIMDIILTNNLVLNMHLIRAPHIVLARTPKLHCTTLKQNRAAEYTCTSAWEGLEQSASRADPPHQRLCSAKLARRASL